MSNLRVRCQCGTVSFHTNQPKPLGIYVCHCLDCRRQSASAFGVSAIFPAEGLWPLPEDVQNKLGMWTRPTDRGNTLQCYFCKKCGVRVMHRPINPDGTPTPTISIKGGCMEGLSLDGAIHIFAKSAIVPVPEGSYWEEVDDY
ncbi:Mss4-like protein [Stachybotrys elegans]|uniref:Mss4-like protein n=1 Tax=Stachybotrys elegans TaxID=80388 RepID=A0A8K0WXG1_9HYPO|nr:Mss4-like protein [Stachybotrys elegans]